VTLDGKGVNGVTLTLVDADSSVVAVAISDSNGVYTLKGLQDGYYRLKVEPPNGMRLEGEEDDLVFDVSSEIDLVDMEIQLCRA
jgi:hypothetical protein